MVGILGLFVLYPLCRNFQRHTIARMTNFGRRAPNRGDHRDVLVVPCTWPDDRSEPLDQVTRKAPLSEPFGGAYDRRGGEAARNVATFLNGPNSAGSLPSGGVSMEGVVDLPPDGI